MGYQITQLYHPLNTDGEVTFFIDQYTTTRTVRIQQAHVETDTGKTIHNEGKGYIDYNRA
jgi:aspartyl-tRNA(Asn)/glutamyl-tRNA(Gln) amidotransferase subunit B